MIRAHVTEMDPEDPAIRAVALVRDAGSAVVVEVGVHGHVDRPAGCFAGVTTDGSSCMVLVRDASGRRRAILALDFPGRELTACLAQFRPREGFWDRCQVACYADVPVGEAEMLYLDPSADEEAS